MTAESDWDDVLAAAARLQQLVPDAVLVGDSAAVAHGADPRNLDGVENGIRQLIRRRPLEVEEILVRDGRLRVPTLEETARIKGWLVLARNATGDYLDFAALAWASA